MKKIEQVIIIGIIALGISTFMLLRTSFSTHQYTYSNQSQAEQYCLNFVNSCNYVTNQYKVKDFKPFNGTAFIVVPFLALTYVCTVILYRVIGDEHLTNEAVVVFLVVGILVFAGFLGSFIIYGDKQKGKSMLESSTTCTEPLNGNSYSCS